MAKKREISHGRASALPASENASPTVFRFDASTTVLPDKHYPLLVRRETCQKDTERHEHVFCEIALVESGTADHLSAGGVRKLHPGDIIVIKQRIWHAYQRTHNLQIINCLFDRKILWAHIKLVSLIENGFELFVRPPQNSVATPPLIFHAQPSQRTQMISNLESIIAEIDQKQKGWKAATAVRLLDFLLGISRLSHTEFATSPVVLNNHALEAVDQAVTFLEANYTEAISVSRLGAQLHISPNYLSRIFSQRMGMGIVHFIHHLRVDDACRQLRSTKTPIGRIAGNVGYNEIAYFSRRFRRETGISPLEYRKKYQGK